MGKYELLRARLAAEMPQLRAALAQPATDGELALVHTPTYIDAVEQGTLSEAALREIGFPWSPGMVERARRSSGATIMASRTAALEGVSANLAGGTHHAYRDKGSGFCVFNDVAVATRLMQAEWARELARSAQERALRVAVIDLDVHQGNGTAAIFRSDPTVFTLSMHGQKNFPFRKESSDLDVELPDGCGDADYLEALDGALEMLWARTADAPPGLMFYLAGADPHENDRLGRLKLTSEGLAERDRRVLQWLGQRGIPVALSMAGGYGRDLPVTVALQARTLELAATAWAHWHG